ncbi:RNA-binding protein 25 [Asparagus officinalis]|nr:RNA-binding protein 25 [Asparagus officinalis]
MISSAEATGRSPAEDKERDDLRYSSRKSRDRDRDRERRRSRSNTPPRVSRRDRDRGRERDGDRDRDQGRDRERDSGRERDRDRGRGRDRDRDRGLKEGKSGGGKSYKGVDYSKIIEGYAQMMPAERVKAKMKLQLSQTAANDTAIGTSSAWERFDFNKDAPLDDDDEETEVAEDDISVVKNLGRSFRFSAVEARREKEVQAAHDQAMFGAPVAASSPVNDSPEPANEAEEDENDAAVGNNGNHLNSNPLLSDKVLSLQQGSWRDRARRIQTGS